MTRQFDFRATAFAASALVLSFAAIAFIDPLPRVIWNASASAPLGLYRIRPDSDPPVGALVAVACAVAELVKDLGEQRRGRRAGVQHEPAQRRSAWSAELRFDED